MLKLRNGNVALQVLALAILLATVVLNAMGGEPAGDPPPENVPPCPATCRNDDILCRLGLSKELSLKIDGLLAELYRDFEAADKKLAPDGANRDEIRALQQQMSANFQKQMRELIPAELRARYDAGMQAYREAKGGEKLERLLDEKVGRKPWVESLDVEEPLPPPTGLLSRQDPVIGRLGLSEEDAKKVDAVLMKWDRMVEKSLKSLEETVRQNGGTILPSALAEERERFAVRRDETIRKMLPAEIRGRFDTGAKLAADFRRKMTKLQTEAQALVVEPGKDPSKPAELKERYEAKAAALLAEFNRGLDDKVGKLPELPKDVK